MSHNNKQWTNALWGRGFSELLTASAGSGGHHVGKEDQKSCLGTGDECQMTYSAAASGLWRACLTANRRNQPSTACEGLSPDGSVAGSSA